MSWISSLFISVPINTVVSLGEEFGWRAYLLPKSILRFARPGFVDDSPAGVCSDTAKSTGDIPTTEAHKAVLLTGIIHGIWHLPLILMTTSLTHGVSVLTPLIYLLFTCSLSILLFWGTLKSGSLLPAAAGLTPPQSSCTHFLYELVNRALPEEVFFRGWLWVWLT